MINIIAAINRYGVIGKNGKIPWNRPGDLKWFSEMTFGGTLIMGRKTYESIGKPLWGRNTLVVSKTLTDMRVCTYDSFDTALYIAKNYHTDIWITGGREIYKEGLQVADKMFLTMVPDNTYPDSECVLFPDFEGPGWHISDTYANKYDEELIIYVFTKGETNGRR